MTEVKVIKVGYFRWIGRLKCEADCTTSLINDEGKKIIVDSGNIQEEKKLLKALKKIRLKPEDIDIAVITHYHPDHVGCHHLFKNAQLIDSEEVFKGDKFDFSKRPYKITKNVMIIRTPGHTEDHCCVLVKTNKGNVLVAGDLFWKGQKENPVLFHDKKLYEKSRKKILKIADYIIPGHADMFKVKK